MSVVTFGGLASGLDTNSIVTGLLGVEKIPLTAIQTHQQNVDAAQTTISSLSSKLATLKSAAQVLSTTSQFTSFKASSSDSGVVATVTGAAQPGALDVSVTSHRCSGEPKRLGRSN